MVDGATYLFDILDMAGPEEYVNNIVLSRNNSEN
jgi:hypothetical protein